MKRIFVAVLAAGLIATVSPVSAAQMDASAPIPCKRQALRILSSQRGMETVSLRDFWIDMKVKKKTYKIGETAVFPVNVSRPAEQDPFGGGVPTDAGSLGPVEGANIGVGLLIGDVFLPGFAMTDANGNAVIKVKIESYVKPAAVDAAFYSWKIVQDTPCLRVEENGFRAVSRMFTVTK